MTKKYSLIIGFGLVILGGLAFVGNLVLPAIGISFRWWEFWRLWPITVISIGTLFCVGPFLAPENRGLGGLFIPGIPILVTGGILAFCSLFDAWDAWSYLWPLEPIALALGFAFAALWMRAIGLVFPAIIIGLNGFVLAFCNLSGWWSTWTVLWTIEPLAIGLSLLVVGVWRNRKILLAVGLGFCGFAAVAAFGMILLVLTGWWVFRYIWPFGLILTGVAVIVVGIIRPNSDDKPPTQQIDPEIISEGSGA